MDMVYNLGSIDGWPGFRTAMEAGNYDKAAEEIEWENSETKLKHSKYFLDVPSRAKEIQNIIKHGII